MAAGVLELGLYSDEPVLVLRAQAGLFRENLRLLRCLLVPCALPCLLFALLYGPLDRTFGRGPLRAGSALVITAPAGSGVAAPVLPPGLVLDSEAVRITRTGQTAWRIKAVSDTPGPVTVAGRPADAAWPAVPWVLRFSAVSSPAGLVFAALARRSRFGIK